MPGAAEGEHILMPFRCSVDAGRAVLTPSGVHAYAILGAHEQQPMTVCPGPEPGACRIWMIHRFDIDCGGVRMPWMQVVAAAARDRGRPVRVEAGRLHIGAAAVPVAVLPPGFAPVTFARARFITGAPPPLRIDAPVVAMPKPLPPSAQPQPPATPRQAPLPAAAAAPSRPADQVPPAPIGPWTVKVNGPFSEWFEALGRGVLDLTGGRWTGGLPLLQIALAACIGLIGWLARRGAALIPAGSRGARPMPVDLASGFGLLSGLLVMSFLPAQLAPDSPAEAVRAGLATLVLLILPFVGVLAWLLWRARIDLRHGFEDMLLVLGHPPGGDIVVGADTAEAARRMHSYRGAERMFAGTKTAVLELRAAVALRDVLLSELDALHNRLRSLHPGRGLRRRPGPQWDATLQGITEELRRLSSIAAGASASLTAPNQLTSRMPRDRIEAFDLLGVNADVSDKVLRKVVDGLRLSWHPDHARDDADRQRREERMKQINSAWELISGKPPVPGPHT